MTYVQDPPNCFQIELTEGCNLFCSFCGLQGIRKGGGQDFKFMTLGHARRIAALIAGAINCYQWNPRLEFAMHGEPTMNPAWLDILEAFRAALPKQNLMLTTNGGGLLRTPGPQHWIDSALRFVNVMAIDAYEYVQLSQKIQARYPRPIPWYPDDRNLNPHRRRRPHEHDLMFIRDISQETTGNHSMLNNHAGAAFPKNNRAQGKRCVKPFREVAVRYNGNVAICCNDWRGEYKVGNILDYDDLNTFWQLPAWQAARKKLYHGQRDFGPCAGCDAISYRVGLLPDRAGKQSLPMADSGDLQAIGAALAGEPYAVPVKRPWEVGIEEIEVLP